MTTETCEKTCCDKEKTEQKKPEVENVGSGTDSDSDEEAPDLEDAPDPATAAAQSQVRYTCFVRCKKKVNWRLKDLRFQLCAVFLFIYRRLE